MNKKQINYQPRVRKVRGNSDSNKKTKIYKKLKKNSTDAKMSAREKLSSCNFIPSCKFIFVQF